MDRAYLRMYESTRVPTRQRESEREKERGREMEGERENSRIQSTHAAGIKVDSCASLTLSSRWQMSGKCYDEKHL